MHAVLRFRQASQGRLLPLRHCLAPPNSDRTLKAGLRQDDASPSLGDKEAMYRVGVALPLESYR
jgi:hypothetical protein